jgi:hypothetical protein
MRNNFPISRRTILTAAGVLPLVFSLPGRSRADTLPLLTVTKDPSCGCCDGWVEHVEAAGFPVRVIESDDVFGLKHRLGVPTDLFSCHTAEVDGYIVEGHVPVAALRRLLAERPDAIGLAVPGMPTGSPGMDFPGVEPELYEVLLFDASGHSVFSRFRGKIEA